MIVLPNKYLVAKLVVPMAVKTASSRAVMTDRRFALRLAKCSAVMKVVLMASMKVLTMDGYSAAMFVMMMKAPCLVLETVRHLTLMMA